MVQVENVSVEIGNISVESVVGERLVEEWQSSAWLDSLFIFIGINLALVFILVLRHLLKNRIEFGEEISLLLHTNYYTRFIYKKYLGKPFWAYALSSFSIIMAGILFVRRPFESSMENLAVTLVFFVLSWGFLLGFEDLWLK